MQKQIKSHSANEIVFGSSLIVLSSLFYGSYGVWTRLMGNNFGPYTQAWIRALLVVILMLPISIFGKQTWRPFRWRKDKWWFALSALASLMLAAPLYFAINRIGIGLATLMMYSGYLASMFLFGWILNGERYSNDKFVATILSLMGLAFTSWSSFGSGTVIAFLAALAAGVSIGLDMAVSQKMHYNSSQTTIIVWGTGLIVNFSIALLLHERAPSLSNHTQWIYLLIFVFMNIAASWTSIHGVKLIEAGAAGILGLLEIVWAMLFGAIFFSERPGPVAYIGALCIVVAAAIPYISEFTKPETGVIEEMPS